MKYYFKFLDNNKKINVPESLINENINFNKINNILESFINDCLIITINEKDRIKRSDINILLSDYNSNICICNRYIDDFFKKKNIKTLKTRGIVMYTSIKLKNIDFLEKVFSNKSITWLLDNTNYLNNSNSK